MSEVDSLKRRVERERAARKAAEKLAEEKTRDLFEAHEELKKFTDHLEEMVEERTSEVAKARDEALEASRAKSEFLANMSHEIRTPLNAVIGLTELMLGTRLDEEQRDFTQTIHNSGEALLAIINDILDFSKIESGHMELELIPFDTRRCVESALDLMAGRAAEKGLELAYSIDGQTPAQIIGDQVRLRQVLLNLVNNAIKFTPEGEVIVEIESHMRDVASGKAGSYEIQFNVRDTGIGIPADRMDRLFKSFFQVDASTTRKFGGTGLGLAISQRLAELMGGRMWVESEGRGKGSTFSFTVVTDAAPCQRHVYLERQQPVLRGNRALVVDDNETNRIIISRQLEGWGMIVETADCGPEALEKLKGELRYELAILDMQMPDMDGVMLARRIRAMYGQSELPLVMLTSLGCRSAEKNTALFSAMLSKPVKTEQLHEALVGVFVDQAKRALKESRQRTVEDTPPDQTTEEGVTDSPLSILLVEDTPVNQKVALGMLKRLGYSADVANNGVEGFKAIKSKQYDVVLMDVQMPEMDGITATKKVRNEIPEDKQPWIIAMTANALVGDRERYLESGMDDYISKPVSQQAIAERLESRRQLLLTSSK